MMAPELMQRKNIVKADKSSISILQFIAKYKQLKLRTNVTPIMAGAGWRARRAREFIHFSQILTEKCSCA